MRSEQVSGACTAGLVEDNVLEDRRPNASAVAIQIGIPPRAVLSRRNHVVVVAKHEEEEGSVP